MLQVSGLHTFYGRIEALRGVDVDVNEGEIVTLIGANGAGKSTLLMTICGDPRAAEGRIVFDRDDITDLPTYEIVRRGIAQSPEGRRIFPFMSVLENLQIGACGTDPAYFQEDLERVFELYPLLKERRHQPIFMVDLAVPRDIEPEIADLRDVYLYSIDDLEQIIAENISNREEAAREAEVIIDGAVSEILAEDRSRDAVDVLVRFRKKHVRIMEAELDKAVQRLKKGEDPESVLSGFATQLTNKMIHTPSVQLKQASTDGREEVIEAITHLFQLDED